MEYSKSKEFNNECKEFLSFLKDSIHEEEKDLEVNAEVMATVFFMLGISVLKSMGFTTEDYIDFCLHLWKEHSKGKKPPRQST